MTASPPPSTGKPTPSPPQSPGTRRGFLVEAWKLGGLEAWLPRWGSAPHPRSPPSPAGALRGRGRFGASRLHALFSVLRSPGRPCRPSPFPKARPAPASPFLRVLCVLCDFQNNLAVLRAPARQNLHQSAGSAFSILAVLRVPSWSFVFFVSAPQGTPSTPLPAPPSLWKTRGPTQKHFAERPVFAKLKV